jgi:glutamine synthetase
METKQRGNLDLETLRSEAEAGQIDTVLLAMTDMQGRLQGKRLTATHFLDEVVEHAAEGCNYLLAVDVEMNTVSGYAMSSWERGYGDFVFKPDMQTLRRVPWQEGTAMVTCDLVWEDGSPVVASPRQILKRQLERLAEKGLKALVGTELEFIVFRDTYEEAWKKSYRDLEPANLYNVDYSLMGTARVEPLLRRIRNEMTAAGLVVENAKGECNFGQHEINFKYDEALTTADGHSIYKNGAKEIAAQEGCSMTFMPKFDEREGNSCHIHLSLVRDDGSPVFADHSADGHGGGHGFSETFRHFLAGQLACLREFTMLFAPNINSYKRFAVGSFAPTAVAWGRDNRTCSMRVVGHGPSLRVENRLSGGDVNPYLAIAAMIAAGLHGIENGLPLEDELVGNAYDSDKPHVPTNLRDARDLFANSEAARTAFGEEVVEHYLNMARVEVEAFEAAVTDWERFRTFERL